MEEVREPLEVRLTGFGGQGVVMTGLIIGTAATMHDKKMATLTRNFGPESRGGACAAGVIISDERISYPYVQQAHVLLCLSKEAYLTYRDNLRPGGVLVYEEDLVKVGQDVPMPPEGCTAYPIAATRIAEQLGRKVVTNMVATGALVAASGCVTREAARQAICDSVPPGTEALNLKAFDRGYEVIKELMGETATA
jgi:2-oxoglutarate ferredoxin oxidoreductase subunit gamma